MVYSHLSFSEKAAYVLIAYVLTRIWQMVGINRKNVYEISENV